MKVKQANSVLQVCIVRKLCSLPSLIIQPALYLSSTVSQFVWQLHLLAM